jgi:hypothetical protein
VSEEKAKQIQAHFQLPEAQWIRFKKKLSSRGYSASLFFREKLCEFLQEEMPVESPLARYRGVYCNSCPYGDSCKSDKTVEIRCLLASLALSLSRLTKKTLLDSSRL